MDVFVAGAFHVWEGAHVEFYGVGVGNWIGDLVSWRVLYVFVPGDWDKFAGLGCCG